MTWHFTFLFLGKANIGRLVEPSSSMLSHHADQHVAHTMALPALPRSTARVDMLLWDQDLSDPFQAKSTSVTA